MDTQDDSQSYARTYSGDIAIVGLSVDVPGAGSAAAFWDNLRNGIESIEVLDEEALLAAGEQPANATDPNYVPAAARLQGFDMFDAEFFGFSPKEAAILDPQHRKFLEVAWSAMEDAGHPPESLDAPIGVYAGCGMGSYFYFNICSNPDLVDEVGMFLLRHTGNDKDFLSTRVSHVFDLKGPSVNIQTACSTSLVAVHYACKALREGECGMALAGGVTIELPQGRGYIFKENEILSPDGHCHAFDHRAQGTVFGSGAGAVALRRLEDAVADGDHIWAVIKGSAINNDGADKAGYLAPSVGGQAAAVRKALAAADVPADTIDYVECHGTGTYLGDPIEVTALTEAYRDSTGEVGYCGIGSVKTNIGHLDTAAGVAGLAKTALALKHRQIPASLGYEAPNPAIDFDHSPFKVNAGLTDWQPHKGPRRAGINALGVGGTNAHVILEEAPERGASEDSDFPFHVLCLSGRSKGALEDNTAALVRWLRANPDANLADVAYTLKEGRRGFAKRRVVVAETATEAADLLEAGDPRQVFTHDHLGDAPEVVFLFPGGGAQYAGMARDLYETEPVFADWMDRGLDHLQVSLDYDIRALWLPEEGEEEAANAALQKPSVQLPLIMIVEYALAQLWMSWGVRPSALVGHSMGENTAACLAGVLSFEDCIDLVLLRGRLFDTVPAGGMLSISLPLAEVQTLIGDDLDIASVNAPGLTAVSGPQAALDRLAEILKARDIDHQRIQIDIAAHSRMLDGILGEYGAFLRRLSLSAPQIPVLSNRSGALLTAEEATDPDYWVRQLRGTVMFATCIDTLAQVPGRIYLEVGPGKALSSLAQMAPAVKPGQVLSSLRHPDQDVMDDAYFFGIIGRLWACGHEADWDQIWGEAKRHRLPLPTYAFQRSRYFIEPGTAARPQETPLTARFEDISDWGYRAIWRPRLADCLLDVESDLDQETQSWLIFEDDMGLASKTADRLEAAGHKIARVRPGDTYAQLASNSYVLAPEQGREGYAALLADLQREGLLPSRIAHFWLVTDGEAFRPGSSFFDRNLEMGFHSLTALSQELGSMDLPQAPHVTVFTTGAAQYRDEPLPNPEKALIAGPARMLPRELPGFSCTTIDIELPKQPAGIMARLKGEQADDITNQLLEEMLAEPGNAAAIWRGDKRFERDWRALPLPSAQTPAFKKGGTYLITGGYGGIGLSIARHLMEHFDANVVLISREGLPHRETWARYLRMHSPANRTAQRIRAVQALDEIGSGEVLPLAADVCNSGQMHRAVLEAEKRFGHLTGVIHGAGAIDDAPLLAKTSEQIAKVLAPKVSGMRVLDALFPDGSLDLMVLFSSSSTVTAPAGQVDYVAANEYLNAFAAHRAGGKTRVVAVDWGVWANAGMAADAMAARQGTGGPGKAAASDQPLLDSQGFDGEGNRIYRTRLDARENWLLNEHRTRSGTAVMPGTGYIELAAEALAGLEVNEDGSLPAIELRDLYFLRPLAVADGSPAELLIRSVAQEEGYALSFYSAVEEGYVLHAEALATFMEGTAPPPVPLEELNTRCARHQAPHEGRLRSPQEAHLSFGPRWHVLRKMAFGTHEGLAALDLSDTAKDDGAILHPGLLDLATGWAISLAPGYSPDALWVPVSYRSIRIHAPLTTAICSHMRLSSDDTEEADTALFDVTLTDASGAVLVEVEGFRMQRLATGFESAATRTMDVTAASIAMAASSSKQPLSEAERRLHHNIAQGIRAEEGGEALIRALTAAADRSLPQIVVSSLDLKSLIAEASTRAEANEKETQSFERPELDTDYVAPENTVEERLAEHFQTLLGIAQVGTRDSFFDLGGHSLIAVRLFAQIKRDYDVEFPLSVLFEAPSVAALADRIIARTGGGVSAETAETDMGGGASLSFTHLVKLHPGDGTGRRPFFIVAGMFGNVLNLRHLAQMIGADRPVYGLQARGLIGSDAPHDRIEDAAADYLREIQEVQPEGPYLLGGFSGGGITAYEMAQQLQAVGEDTAALILLDTPLPVRPALSRKDKALIKLQEIRLKGPSYLTEWARNRIAWEVEKRRDKPAESGTTPVFNNRRIELAFRDAVATYTLRGWDGEMTLLRPPLDRHWPVSGGRFVSAEREYVYPDNDWTRWAPKLEVVEVPGNHDSMVLVPNVSVLATEVKARLDLADSRPAPRSTHHQAAE